MRIAAGSLVLFAAALSAQPPPDRTFVEEIEVAESSVVIELPRLGRVSPEEFERLERRLLLRFVAEEGGPDREALAALRFLPVEVRLAEVSRFADRRKFKRWLGLVPQEERLRFGRWIRFRP